MNADAPADAVPVRLRASADPSLAYWLCAPAGARRRDAPILVAVHGISRNAGALARAFAPRAERDGFVLVAPHFPRTRYPDYQRLGRPARMTGAGRADHALRRLVDEVRRSLGLAASPLLLFGHSGGAQFVQRFVIAHPDAVGACALGAPGAYAWPGRGRRFPFGLEPSEHFPDVAPRLDALLDTPTLVLVGARDRVAGPSLRRGPRLDATQGTDRVERARGYVAELRRLAALDRRHARVSLALLPGCGHAFSECVARGGLVERVADHLAGAARRATDPGQGSIGR